jgi:hypothetical protein
MLKCLAIVVSKSITFKPKIEFSKGNLVSNKVFCLFSIFDDNLIINSYFVI